MAHAQQWVGLTHNSPAEPNITVIRSTNQQVSFTVSVLGFYAETKTEGGVAYQRLSIPACGVTGTTGEPEIPVIGTSIAVPVCSSISYSITVLASQTLQNYRVYPVPERQLDHAGMLQEVFALNPSAYLQNSFTPNARYGVAETGAFREQHYVTLAMNPIRFNPVSEQLEVVTEMEITLTFNNPTTAVNVNTGIFNRVAAESFINYEDNGMSALVNDRAFEKPNFTRGNVQWITLTNPAQADTISADYVIITVPEFFTPNNPTSQLKRLAEHRAYYNGYNVAILNVADILSDVVGFYYEGTPLNPNDTTYKLEQRLRTCIRRIYEGAHAQHTGDGHLGYVLLVGDNYANNTMGMPTGLEHGIRYPSYPGGPIYPVYPSDYYFSCVTKGIDGKYDHDGDLSIGRFSVENNPQLYNMVHKTINHETLYNADNAWRKTAGIIHGWDSTLPWYPGMINFHTGLLNEIEWDACIVGTQEIRIPTLNCWNNGVVYSSYETIRNILPTTWEDNLNVDTVALRLHNDHKAPFMATFCHQSGRFDDTLCMAEYMTRYDSIRGAVGFIGASRGDNISWTYSDTNFLSFNCAIPYFLFHKNVSIAGDLLLTSKKRYLGGSLNPFEIRHRYVYNLFGDPALNILAEPTCRQEITDIQTIHNGQNITVTSDCDLHFRQNGQLIVEEGGALIVEDGARIFGDLCKEIPVIHIQGGEVRIGENVIFQDLIGGILLEKGANAAYGDMEYNIDNVTFNHTPVKHLDTKLNISNCTFTNRSDIHSMDSEIEIQDCTFSESGFVAATIKKSILTPSYVKIANSAFFNTGEFLIDPYMMEDSIYSTASIMLRGIREFEIADNTITNMNGNLPSGEGIYLNNAGNGKTMTQQIRNNEISNCKTGLYVYNSKAQFLGNKIFDNGYGACLYNNSQTSFLGDDEITPINYGEQIIRDNIFYQLYASHDAFPVPFSYNQISKINNDHTIPWIYYDAYPSQQQIKADVRYNCWGANFVQAKDLYPTGGYLVNPIWCPGGKALSLSPEEELYQTAIDYFSNEDYPTAETTFKDLITTYPNSPFAIAALHELFALEQFLNNDYAALNGYYSTFTPADTALFNVAAFLATRCNVQERNWQPAIDWYEDRIENPPSYQDSVFAVRDLGDIHLMMAADTLGGAKGMHHCSYRLAQVKPNSKREYEENKTALLATLPRIEKPQIDKPQIEDKEIKNDKEIKGSLGQNIPNPTKGTAIIGYEIYKEGAVEIRIYNVLGQVIQTLPQGMKKTGHYQTTISLSNVPAGVYNYMLFIDDEKADGKKMVKQ